MNYRRITIAYLTIFGILMLIYNSVNPPRPRGEWDDYSFPIASILNDQNLSITADDIERYKRIFPAWTDAVDQYMVNPSKLSGHMTKDKSGELPWYFPTYGIACMPMTGFLYLMGIPTVYAFPFTNLVFLLVSIFYMYKCLKVDEKRKILILLLLTLNPIVFYIGWISAEVLIYSMLVMGMTAWYNGWSKRAAIFVSIAGTLNPVIMSIGMVMIAEYLIDIIRRKDGQLTWWQYLKGHMTDIIKYGCCYVIGVIPMAYNFYHTGHINLTASVKGFTNNGLETTGERFLAYLFDLNFGILPYFPILLAVSLLLAIVSIARRRFAYLAWLATFLVNVALYSIMTHINSGMSGIARYNAWGAVILIFAVAGVGLDMVSHGWKRKTLATSLELGAVVTTWLILAYGPYGALNAPYIQFTPVATFALDNFPHLYNPLFSTFNSRETHKDGGYKIRTPVIYSAKDGYVRKILANECDKGLLMDNLISGNGEMGALLERIAGLKGMGYISVEHGEKVAMAPKYRLGDTLGFSTYSPEGNDYVLRGVNGAEGWGSWSEGDTIVMQMRVDSDRPLLHADLKARVYNHVQSVKIYANDIMVYDNSDYRGEGIQFDFENPGAGKPIILKFKLPKAISPTKFGYGDMRILGIGLIQMTISESTRPKYHLGDTIDFSSQANNATNYIASGVNKAEEWGSWSSGKAMEMLIPCDNPQKTLHAHVDCKVFPRRQSVRIFVNGKLSFSDSVSKGKGIDFSFAPSPLLRIRFELPGAVSPSEVSGSSDTRVIALGLQSMTIKGVDHE